MGIPQGDLKLLDGDIAKRLLNSKIPARLAYIAKDGTPRVIPTWFDWDGSELVMATFIGGPHVRHEPARPAALRKNPGVAITIDTEGFPPHVLLIRGQASVTEVDGLAKEFREGGTSLPRRGGRESVPRADEQARCTDGSDRGSTNLGRRH